MIFKRDKTFYRDCAWVAKVSKNTEVIYLPAIFNLVKALYKKYPGRASEIFNLVRD